MSKFMAFAGTIAALSTISFAWSISGVVSTNEGMPLSAVKISSSNFPDIAAMTSDVGAFSIVNDELSLHGTKTAKASVSFSHNIISISNVNAQTLTVSVMDALGKVCAAKTRHFVNGYMQIDLNKSSARGAKFIRINADGKNSTYKLGKTVSLLKDGDPLPTFIFKKDGYKDQTYTMTKEVETNVKVLMEAGVNEVPSSSSVELPASSSSEITSSETVSSSSVVPQIDCSGKTLKSDAEITVDGRKVIVKFPNGWTGEKAAPMLINYHQIFGSASNWVNDSKIGKVALADGAISIYPDGAQTPENAMGQAWNVGPCCTTADDVQFTRDIIKELTEKACVDPKRIYAAGWSMGGGMANYLGCTLADMIAAAVPSAFDLAAEVLGQCNPARPYPVLNFRSSNDAVVDYNGASSQIVPGMPITFIGAKATFAKWAELNHCSGEPVQKDGCEFYENCQGGAVVGLCTLNTDHNEGDGQKAWNFVKQFSLP